MNGEDGLACSADRRGELGRGAEEQAGRRPRDADSDAVLSTDAARTWDAGEFEGACARGSRREERGGPEAELEFGRTGATYLRRTRRTVNICVT